MQRIFSTFPNAWPGAGLLLLRCVAATILLAHMAPGLGRPADAAAMWLQVSAAGVGLLLLIGLWTPISCIAMAVIEVWLAIKSGWLGGDHIVCAAIGISLAMLGPGTWSVDARLYGRKRMEF
jgi:uncharacterized membrane protein YphA (DoxX/SURF4 family)